MGHQARGIVEQAHQVGLAHPTLDRHARAMHHVAVPQAAGEAGDETATLLRHAGAGARARQAVLLQQAMHGRARHRSRADQALGVQDAQYLANRARRPLLLGLEDGLLDRVGEPGVPAVDPLLGRQAINAGAPVLVIPGQQRLLAQMVAARSGNVVGTLRQFAHDALGIAARQVFAAEQRPEHHQAKQRHGVNLRQHHRTPRGQQEPR